MKKKSWVSKIFHIVAVCMIGFSVNGQSVQNVYASNEVETLIDFMGMTKIEGNQAISAKRVITREEFAQMLVQSSPYRDSYTGKSRTRVFKDVPRSNKRAEYIQIAVIKGYMSGGLGGKFNPKQPVRLSDMVQGGLALLGYSGKDFTEGTLAEKSKKFETLGLQKNLRLTKNQAATYQDCVNFFYNLLHAKTASGEAYAQTLGYELNAKGKLDEEQIRKQTVKGPYIVDFSAHASLLEEISDFTIYKNGKKQTKGALNQNDVFYYSKELKRVWVYNQKVSGLLETIEGGELAPTGITILGKTYKLESFPPTDTDGVSVSESWGSYLKDNGIYEGVYVTVLLGQNQAVVDVQSTKKISVKTVGYVLKVEDAAVKDSSGTLSLRNKIQLVDSTGTVREFIDYDRTIVAGNTVEVDSENGETTITNLPVSSGSAITLNFAAGANIIEVDKQANQYVYKKVYPSTLQGTSVAMNKVLYMNKNNKGEITDLILRHATGSLYEYGVITDVTTHIAPVEFDEKGNVIATRTEVKYKYEINGKESTYSVENPSTIFEKGPKAFSYDSDGKLVIQNINSITLQYIARMQGYTAQASYQILPGAAVYFYEKGSYSRIQLSDIERYSSYRLEGYIGGQVEGQGFIQLIVVTKKS